MISEYAAGRRDVLDISDLPVDGCGDDGADGEGLEKGRVRYLSSNVGIRG